MTMYEAMKNMGIKICPKCGKEYTEHSAISRVDNKTEICSRCGIREAFKYGKVVKEENDDEE